MCAQPVPGTHSHVVHLEGRALMCACRPCYLLFAGDADQRYRAVPDRYLRFPAVSADGPSFDALDIPVGLAFLFHNSRAGTAVAFYPGPAGATESELPLEAWDGVIASHPELATLRPDVEALLVRRAAPGAAHSGSCHLVPIDVCYELVGTPAPGLARLRRRRRGPRRDRRLLRHGRRAERRRMTLTFAVRDIVAEPHAVTPQLTAKLRVDDDAGRRVHAMALRCQVRVDPQRRGYDDAEGEALRGLFGGRERWVGHRALVPVAALRHHRARLRRRHRGRPGPALHVRPGRGRHQLPARAASRHAAADLPLLGHRVPAGRHRLLGRARALGPEAPRTTCRSPSGGR